MKNDELADARLSIAEATEEATFSADLRYNNMLMSQAELNERAEKHTKRDQLGRIKSAADEIVTVSKEEIIADMEKEQRKEQMAEQAEMGAKAAEKKFKESETRNQELKKQADEANTKLSAAESKSKEVSQKAKDEAAAAIAQAKAKAAEDKGKQQQRELGTKQRNREKAERDRKSEIQALGLSFADQQAMLAQLEAEMAAAEASHEASVKSAEANAKAQREAQESSEKATLTADMNRAKLRLAALQATRVRVTSPDSFKTVDGNSCVIPFHYNDQEYNGCVQGDANYEGPARQGWCPVGSLGAKCFAQSPTHRLDGDCADWTLDPDGLPTGKWAACAVPPSKHEFVVQEGHKPAGSCGAGGEKFSVPAKSLAEAESVCSSISDCKSFVWFHGAAEVSICGVDSAGSSGVVSSAVPEAGVTVGDRKARYSLSKITAAVKEAQKQANDAETALVIARSEADVAAKRRKLERLKRERMLRVSALGEDDRVRGELIKEAHAQQHNPTLGNDTEISSGLELEDAVKNQEALVNHTREAIQEAKGAEQEEELLVAQAKDAATTAEAEVTAEVSEEVESLHQEENAALVAAAAEEAEEEQLEQAGEQAAMIVAEEKRAAESAKDIEF